MAQWGRNDQAVTANSTTTAESSSGAPIGTYALVNGGSTSNIATISAAHTPNGHFGNTSSGSRAAIDATMFSNTTINAFRQGQAVGVFGLDTTEMSVTTGSSNGIYRVTSGGTGYGANASVSLTFSNSTSTYANALAANSTVGTSGADAGRVTAVTGNSTVTGIIGQVSLAIAAPASINITANSTSFANGTVAGASNSSFIISSANTRWQAGDRLYYGVPTANTPIAPLSGNAYYYVSFANSTVIKLATTASGSNIAITDTRVLGAAETHTFTGDTATAVLIPSGGKRHAAHAGWVLRTEGTGGRAGRVQFETLVAMGSLGAQTAAYGTAALVPDATEDNIFHDS
jgi:hypothetical protein